MPCASHDTIPPPPFTPKHPLGGPASFPWAGLENPMGKILLSLFFPHPPLSQGCIWEPGIKLIHWFNTTLEVGPWLPWVVLGPESLPADRVSRVFVTSSAINNAIKFPFLLAGTALPAWFPSLGKHWEEAVSKKDRDFKKIQVERVQRKWNLDWCLELSR